MGIQLFPRWAVALALGVAISLTGPAALAAQKKTPTPTAGDASKTSKPDKAGKINLNTADEKTIAGAKGVGEKLAKELVKNRPYKTWEDVSAVKGVGSGKKLDSLKKVLKLSEGVAAAADEKTAKDKGSKTAKASEAAPAAAAGTVAAGSTKAKPATSEKSDAPKIAPGTKININTATKEQLDALPEIGPVKAQAIVDYRNANGKFASPEDIMKVPGIKEGTFAKIKDYVVVR
jgi:competence protein ComEA